MTRKPTTPRPRTPARAKRTSSAVSTQLHLPRTWRTVTARKLRASQADRTRRAPRREVPEIRLSGAWLDRIGFVKGRRYLVSVDREIETIYLQAEAALPVLKKKR